MREEKLVSSKKSKEKLKIIPEKSKPIVGLNLINETDMPITLNGIGVLKKGQITPVPEKLVSQMRQNRKSLEQMGVSVIDKPSESEG